MSLSGCLQECGGGSCWPCTESSDGFANIIGDCADYGWGIRVIVLGARIFVCSLMAVLVIVMGAVETTVLTTVVALSKTSVVVKGRVLVRREVKVRGLIDLTIV